MGEEKKFSIVNIDLSGLSKPATKLLEVIENIFGAIHKPTGIRREAKAEADAQIIRIEGDIAAMEVARRASERITHRELRRQENIDAIVGGALEELQAGGDDNVSDDPVDEDWTARFFDRCQDIGQEQMQSLWSRLLAGEVRQPGSFSPRTLETAGLLTTRDAHLFTLFCGYVWDNNVELIHLYTGDTDEVLAKNGIHFRDLLHLQVIGLVETGPLIGLDFKERNLINLWYFGRIFGFERIRDTQLKVRILTNVGVELSRVCGAEPDEEYLDALFSSLHQQGRLATSTWVSSRDNPRIICNANSSSFSPFTSV